MYDVRMKISKISNKSAATLAGIVLAALLVSCGSTKVEPPAPVVEEAPPAVEEPEPAPVAEELPPAVEEEPVVEPEKEPEPVDDEYARSVGDIAVSRDTFAEDKETILRIISELDSIMKDSNSNQSYNAWLGYVDQESIDYWKLRKNLQKAEKRLPVKGIKLQNLQDYFKQVFCPARKGREVTEIRYISDTYVKAIQVQERQDIVYYYFNKINGKWMVHIPPIDN